MPTLSKASFDKLSTCHPDLQRVVREAIKYVDFTVLCGHRGEAEQTAAFKAGSSKLQWPNSRHNKRPSEAVDLAPYPVDWRDLGRFHFLAGVIAVVARQLGVDIAWGGDWATFKDRPHFELRKRT